jgi:hypothetical protein
MSFAEETDTVALPGTYVVRRGDHLARIAAAHGLSLERIWNHPSNATLRRRRASPAVLLAGDEVHLPAIETKTVRSRLEATHRFVLAPRSTELRFVVRLRDGTVIDDEPCRLSFRVGDRERTIEARTAADGTLDVRVPVRVREARLTLVEHGLSWRIAIGHLDPDADGTAPVVTGIQARLNNLGWHCGPIDGELGPKTRKAIASFQRIVLGRDEPTGELDDETRCRIVREHGG